MVATAVVAAPRPAMADDPDVPSRSEVRAAGEAAEAGERDVVQVRADLAAAQVVVDRTAISAARAAEEYNGARYVAQQARAEAALARRAERAASARVERVRTSYAEVVRGSLGTNRDLEALSSIMASEDLGQMLERTTAYRIVGSTLDARYDELTLVREEAEEASDAAAAARVTAQEARSDAAVKRDRAEAAATRAEDEAAKMAARTRSLVAELARLRGVSVDVAVRRREGLARRAAERAEAEARAQQEAVEAAESGAPAQESGAAPIPADDESESSAPPSPTSPAPAPEPTPAPAPGPAPAPAPASGAAAAVKFARAQLGEPYVWAAAGPDQWDCSGLTMRAWAAGGTSLPHYSVAQYDASTPISASERRPGDLVFWASSDDPSSIYHVALYVGGDRIIHAPRTGRPVSEDSLFYWITPSFYARP